MEDSSLIFDQTFLLELEPSESVKVENILEKFNRVFSTILKVKHSHPYKWDIDASKEKSITFACPYCGDSATRMDLKRGHLYRQNLFFVCYNCGEHRDFSNFLKDFNITESFTPSEIKFIKTDPSLKSSTSVRKGLHTIYDILGIDAYAFNRSDVMEKYELIEVKDDPKIMDYLRNRKMLGVANHNHLAYQPRYNRLTFFNLTRDETKVVSLQFRNQIIGGKIPRFITQEYSAIAQNKFEILEDKDEVFLRMNKISNLYNVLRIRFDQNVWIFEGATDTSHFINSMGTLSAGNKFYFPQGLYFYDNDDRGRKEATLMLKEQYHVFLWKKFLRENPYYRVCSWNGKEPKDFNDLYRIATIHPQTVLEYFSSEPLNLIYL